MFGDCRDGALGGGLVEIFGEQVAHDGVARSAAVASHHHADQKAVAAMHRGHEIEAGGAGVAGLDTVDALDAADQMIVVADGLAVIVERSRRSPSRSCSARRLVALRRRLSLSWTRRAERPQLRLERKRNQ